MAIYDPAPHFNSNDRRLLALLGRLALESCDDAATGRNTPRDWAALTDSELEDLRVLLWEFASRREFREAAFFAEGLTQSGALDDPRLRELYLQSRRRGGRLRVMASRQWAEFLVRLGLRQSFSWIGPVAPMPRDYFLKMEQRLLLAAGLSPRVVDFVIQVVKAQTGVEPGLSNRYSPIPFGSFREEVAVIVPGDLGASGGISTARAASLIGLCADLSIMFTTRDWTVAGTLSSIYSYGAMAIRG